MTRCAWSDAICAGDLDGYELPGEADPWLPDPIGPGDPQHDPDVRGDDDEPGPDDLDDEPVPA